MRVDLLLHVNGGHKNHSAIDNEHYRDCSAWLLFPQKLSHQSISNVWYRSSNEVNAAELWQIYFIFKEESSSSFCKNWNGFSMLTGLIPPSPQPQQLTQIGNEKSALSSNKALITRWSGSCWIWLQTVLVTILSRTTLHIATLPPAFLPHYKARTYPVLETSLVNRIEVDLSILSSVTLSISGYSKCCDM